MVSDIPGTSTPLHTKDDATAGLVARLAMLRGSSKQDAVKLAVQAELDRMEEVPLRDRFTALRVAYPLPAGIGAAADKAFFDEVSGGL